MSHVKADIRDFVHSVITNVYKEKPFLYATVAGEYAHAFQMKVSETYSVFMDKAVLYI